MNTSALFQEENSQVSSEAHREGPVARGIEQQTAKVPSDVFLWAALGSICGSLAFQVFGKKETANFIGHWAPTFLVLGLYNKLVKVAGSDGESLSQSSGRNKQSRGNFQGNRTSGGAAVNA
jgi:hypothetical protein